ncbi:MAG: O-antigen ligase family protein [Candidatus Coatesbacteria bacterium]|nr:O-antigen ligase family protein [Candidatus Coatesbacteria bacterium]
MVSHDVAASRPTRSFPALFMAASLAILSLSAALGCQTALLDFSVLPQELSGRFDVVQGKLRGAADGTLIVEPLASSSTIAIVLRPGEVSAGWAPIIDMGVDFSDIERHSVCVFWRGHGQQFSPERSECGVFNLKYVAGPHKRQRLTLNLAGNPEWKGTIEELKVVLAELTNPVGIDFVRFPSSQLLSLLMPHRKWFGFDKRFFLAYLPVLLVLILCGLNTLSALRGMSKDNDLEWRPAGRATEFSWRLLFWGLGTVFVLNAIFPFDFFPYLKFPLAGVHILLPEILLVLLSLLLATLIGPRILRFTAVEWAFLAFIGAAVLSFKNARSPDHALLRVIYYLAPAALFMTLGRGILSQKSKLALARRFTVVALIAAFWVALNGAIEGFLDHNYLLDTFYRAFAPIYVEYTFGTPIASSFVDPSVLGSFIVMSLPLALFFAIHHRQNGALRIFGLASVVVLSISLAYACSYGSLVAVIVALSVYFLRKHKRLILGFCVGCIVAAALSAIFVTPQYKQYLANVEDVDRLIRQGNLTQDQIVELARTKLDHTLLYSVNQRVDGAISALRMLREHPLCGIGMGNFEPFFDDYYRKDPEALRIYKVPDNVLFMILAETGALGLLTFLVFIALVVRACLRALKATDADRYWNAYVWAVCAAILGFGVNCLAYDGLFWFSPSFAFWAILGMFLPLADQVQSPKSEVESPQSMVPGSELEV